MASELISPFIYRVAEVMDLKSGVQSVPLQVPRNCSISKFELFLRSKLPEIPFSRS